MLTADDVKRLIDGLMGLFPTKQEFQELKDEVATKNDFRQVMTKVDAVFKEVKDMRQEQTVHNQQHEDINVRLDKLEDKVFGSSPN